MAIKEDLNKLLSGTTDERLEVIQNRTEERLKIMLGVDVPDDLSYIVMEVTLKRYNRIGQEGMQSYSQDGLSMNFPTSDFDEFSKDINDWLKNQEKEKNKNGKFALY